jgi:hypothetical protein
MGIFFLGGEAFVVNLHQSRHFDMPKDKKYGVGAYVLRVNNFLESNKFGLPECIISARMREFGWVRCSSLLFLQSQAQRVVPPLAIFSEGTRLSRKYYEYEKLITILDRP